jgi:hypothetical protein
MIALATKEPSGGSQHGYGYATPGQVAADCCFGGERSSDPGADGRQDRRSASCAPA